jgi:hypothetical protein
MIRGLFETARKPRTLQVQTLTDACISGRVDQRRGISTLCSPQTSAAAVANSVGEVGLGQASKLHLLPESTHLLAESTHLLPETTLRRCKWFNRHGGRRAFNSSTPSVEDALCTSNILGKYTATSWEG